MSLRSEPMLSGRKWTFEHDGVAYEIVTYNGSESVHLYYRRSGNHKFSRHTYGKSARMVADQIHADVRDGKA
jgi:hypothetical protein